MSNQPRIDLDGMTWPGPPPPSSLPPFKASRREVNNPIVDISPVLFQRKSGDIEKYKEHIKQIGLDINAICKKWGYFHITGHGISNDLQDAALTRLPFFFEDLAKEEKDSIHRTNSLALRGYEGADDPIWLNSHRVAQTESFTWGPEQPNSTRFLQGANQWPSEDQVPGLRGFRTKLMEWQTAMRELAWIVCRLICDSLMFNQNTWRHHLCEADALWFSSAHRYHPGMARAVIVDEDGEKHDGGKYRYHGIFSLLVGEDEFVGPHRQPQGDFSNYNVTAWNSSTRVYNLAGSSDLASQKQLLLKKDYICVILGSCIEQWSNGEYIARNFHGLSPRAKDEYTMAFSLEPRLDHELITEWYLSKRPCIYPTVMGEQWLRMNYNDQFRLSKKKAWENAMEDKRNGKRAAVDLGTQDISKQEHPAQDESKPRFSQTPRVRLPRLPPHMIEPLARASSLSTVSEQAEESSPRERPVSPVKPTSSAPPQIPLPQHLGRAGWNPDGTHRWDWRAAPYGPGGVVGTSSITKPVTPVTMTSSPVSPSHLHLPEHRDSARVSPDGSNRPDPIPPATRTFSPPPQIPLPQHLAQSGRNSDDSNRPDRKRKSKSPH